MSPFGIQYDILKYPEQIRSSIALWGYLRCQYLSEPPMIGIRRPLLARGTKAAGFGLDPFLSISSYCFSSYQAILLCLKRAQKPPRSASPNHSPRIWFHRKNPSVFKSVFNAKKSRENRSRSLQRNDKMPF